MAENPLSNQQQQLPTYQSGWEDQQQFFQENPGLKPSVVVPALKGLIGAFSGDKDLLEQASALNTRNQQINSYNEKLKVEIAKMRHDMLKDKLSGELDIRQIEATEKLTTARVGEAETASIANLSRAGKYKAEEAEILTKASINEMLIDNPELRAIAIFGNIPGIRHLSDEDKAEALTAIRHAQELKLYTTPIKSIDGFMSGKIRTYINDPTLSEEVNEEGIMGRTLNKEGRTKLYDDVLILVTHPDYWEKHIKECEELKISPVAMMKMYLRSIQEEHFPDKPSLIDRWKKEMLRRKEPSSMRKTKKKKEYEKSKANKKVERQRHLRKRDVDLYAPGG